MNNPGEKEFAWQSFLFSPIKLSRHWKQSLRNSSKWCSWERRYQEKDNEILDDIRRFFIAPVREKLFPLCAPENCLRLTLNVEAVDGGMPWLPGEDGKPLASIAWIDLLALDTFSLLIFKLEAPGSLKAKDLYALNRKAPEWFARSLDPNAKVSHWRTSLDDSTTLKGWVEKRLFGFTLPESREVFGDTDWFGHSLPMVSFVGVNNCTEVSADKDFVSLLTGAPYGSDHYDLCSQERERLTDQNVMQVYKNWLVGDLNNRVLFYSVGGQNTPLYKNLEKHYIYISAIVFYQKIMLTYFLERFLSTSINENEMKRIRGNILYFRKEYVFNKLSTYSLGEKLYQFFFKNDDVQSLVDRLTYEIESSDEFERLVLERKENRVLNFIAIFAAITLPVTTVGTIYGVGDRYVFSFSSFWVVSGIATFVFLILIFILLISNKISKTE